MSEYTGEGAGTSWPAPMCNPEKADWWADMRKSSSEDPLIRTGVALLERGAARALCLVCHRVTLLMPDGTAAASAVLARPSRRPGGGHWVPVEECYDLAAADKSVRLTALAFWSRLALEYGGCSVGLTRYDGRVRLAELAGELAGLVDGTPLGRSGGKS